jgi:glycosyltransferase involved in cell wall biosynthesis
VYRLPVPSSEGGALLQRADALLVPSGELLLALARTFGVDKGRAHVVGYSGPGAVQNTIAAYGAAVLGCSRRVAGLRRDRGGGRGCSGVVGRDERLAIVTPLPPERTGIAFYSARLIKALARHIRVDVYREDNEFDNPFDSGLVHCFPARGLQWRWELTAPALPPLYCLGNNHFHVHAWRALMCQWGDVLLHDVRLAGLYAALVKTGMLTRPQLGERIRLIEGQTPDSARPPDSPIDPEMMMIGEVVDRARRIYVHTEHGREMILHRRPQRAQDVFVVPFALPPARRDREPSNPPIVAAFGYVYNDLVLADMAREILAKHPEARIRVVGDSARPGQLEEMRRLAVNRGLQGRLEFVGWADENQYHRELRQATVALQLRMYSNGERSASVADCIAAGVPTVVNDFGSFAELPADVVFRVSKYPRPQEVAAAVTALLDDERRQRQLSAAALAYAQTNDAEHAAQALLRLIGAGP